MGLTAAALLVLAVIAGVWWQAVVGGVIGVAFFAVQEWVLGSKAIGKGDKWLGGVMGMALGPVLVLPSILLGYILGSVYAVYLLARKRATKATRLPLGVYLSTAWLIGLFFGPWLRAWLFG